MAVGDAERQAAARVVAGTRLAQVTTGDQLAQFVPRAHAADLGDGLTPRLGDIPINLLGPARRSMNEHALFETRLVSFFFRSDSPSHLASALESLSVAADRDVASRTRDTSGAEVFRENGRSTILDVFATFEGYQGSYYTSIPAGGRKEALTRLDAAGQAGWQRLYDALTNRQTSFQARVYDVKTDSSVTSTIAITRPMAFEAGYVAGFTGGRSTPVTYTATLEGGVKKQYQLDENFLKRLAQNNPDEFKQLMTSLRQSMDEVYTPGERGPTLGRSFNMGAVAGILKRVGHDIKLSQAVVPGLEGVRHAQVGQEALGILGATAIRSGLDGRGTVAVGNG